MHDNKIFSRSLLATACAATLLAANPAVQASGFAIPELNVAGMALSNALVANPEMQAAIAYNPAAMSFHEGSSLALGVLFLKPDLSVDTGSGSTDSDANDVVAAPSITAHTTLSESWALGIAVNAPFGLETEWAAGTYESQYPPGMDVTVPTKTNLEIVAFSPSVSYKFNDNVSLAGGIDIYDMREVVFDSTLNAGTPGSNPAVKLKGDGRGVGLNLGLMVKQGQWSFGGSYHTEAHIPVEGKVKSPVGSTDVEADLDLPSRLQLGVRHQTTDKLALEFDFTRTGWSSFDQLVVDESQYGINVTTSTNDWDDANAYRLGATYDISTATQLRVGYTYDETPQDDNFFSPRIPDSDRQLFSLGIGHTLSNGWTIDAAYMYVKFDDRNVNLSKTSVENTPTLGYPETNGTSAVNGDYDSSVSLIGLGVTKKFM
jgi:long-chain fatty acid transport protein